MENYILIATEDWLAAVLYYMLGINDLNKFFKLIFLF